MREDIKILAEMISNLAKGENVDYELFESLINDYDLTYHNGEIIEFRGN